jgi:phage-related protein
MRKLIGMGACMTLALLLTSCGEQTKKAKDATTQAAKDAGKSAQDAGKSAQEAGKAAQEAGKAAQEAVSKTGQEAGKVAQEAGKTAQEAVSKAGEAAGKTLAETQAKISAAATKASEALGEQFTKATEQATQTLKDVKGAPDVLQKVGQVFPSLQKTLAGITDKESAQKALPKLDELESTVSKLSSQFGNLPEGAKETVGALVQKGMSNLQPLVDSVLALPAVQAIRPKLEGILSKLKNLDG